MDATELANTIGGAVNSGIDTETFIGDIRREHPYLQRVMFREVLKPGIIALAGMDYSDRRNDREVRSCREVCDKMGWNY